MIEDEVVKTEKYKTWWKELNRLAKDKECEHFISDDPGDHIEGYTGGNSPDDELQGQINAYSG